MSEALGIEELRERVDALTDSIASLSGGMERLRQDLFAKEKRARDLDADLKKARRVGTGLFATILETMMAMGEAFPKVGGAIAGVCGVGALLVGLTQCQECDAPPEPMRLEGLGTVMISTVDESLLGARCNFFARQVGRGVCLFELECEGEGSTYAEVHRCETDAYTEDTGEGGTSTSYYLRGMGLSESGRILSFSEYQGVLELKDGDSIRNLVFHELGGRSVLETERTWPPAADE